MYYGSNNVFLKLIVNFYWNIHRNRLPDWSVAIFMVTDQSGIAMNMAIPECAKCQFVHIATLLQSVFVIQFVLRITIVLTYILTSTTSSILQVAG